MSKSITSTAYNVFRTHLIEVRKLNGLTQADIAMELGKPQSFVSKYERGERRLDVVEFLEIARVLGIEPVGILKELQEINAKDNS